MKPIDVKSDSWAEHNVESNEKGPKFKINDRVRISKYKNIFAKLYTKFVRRSFCYYQNQKYSSMDFRY